MKDKPTLDRKIKLIRRYYKELRYIRSEDGKVTLDLVPLIMDMLYLVEPNPTVNHITAIFGKFKLIQSILEAYEIK